MTSWRADVLGDGFACTEIDLGSDAEGPLVATLVRSLPEQRTWLGRLLSRPLPLEDVDVLYVHGWSDYFFQKDLATYWTSRGGRFFALDLRKYGRSLRPGQTPGYVADLAEYDAEIGHALAIIRSSAAPRRRLVLLGHSTGGLILSLWLSRNPGAADALVLNSPWLEFQLSRAARQLLTPIIDLTARLNPREHTPQLDFGYYSRAQHEVGALTDANPINAEWRPERAHGVTRGWMRAILAGHATVSHGLNIQVPVQVLLSARSAIPTRWSDDLTRADTVLDVEGVAQAALRLGQTVTVDRIDGALHDVFLSADEARAEAYRRMERWIVGWHANDPSVGQDARAAQQPGGDAVPASLPPVG